jgi:NADPH:quinone reductase
VVRPAGRDRLRRRQHPETADQISAGKEHEVSGLQVSDYRKRRPGELRTAYSEIFGYYTLGRVRPAPVVPFGLDEAGTALAAVRDRRIEGRAVLRLRGD